MVLILTVIVEDETEILQKEKICYQGKIIKFIRKTM